MVNSNYSIGFKIDRTRLFDFLNNITVNKIPFERKDDVQVKEELQRMRAHRLIRSSRPKRVRIVISVRSLVCPRHQKNPRTAAARWAP